ncbi:MAG: hypothetical protein K1X67_10350 [Fimbriimonadaceae bacterium]|nr:hypothetical protein [Fimbriimonadaceae bacterium]
MAGTVAITERRSIGDDLRHRWGGINGVVVGLTVKRNYCSNTDSHWRLNGMYEVDLEDQL